MTGTHSTITRKALLALGLAVALAVPVCAQVGKKAFTDPFGIPGKKPVAGNGAEWTATLERGPNEREVVLRLAVKVAADHHIYPTTVANGALMKFEIGKTTGVEPIDDGFLASRSPEFVKDPTTNDIEQQYRDQVEWTRKYRVVKSAAGEVAISGEVIYQICDDSNCRPGQKFRFAVTLNETTPANLSPARSVSPTVEELSANDDGAGGLESRFEQKVGPRGSQTVGGSWQVSVSPRQAIPGGQVTVTVTAKLQPGWHVYAVNQEQLEGGEGPNPTGIGLTEFGALLPHEPSFRGPHPIEYPSKTPGWEGLTERYHEGEVRWTRTLGVPADGVAGDVDISGKVAWAMCNSGGCLPPTGFEFRGSVTIGEEEISAARVFTVASNLRVPAALDTIAEFRVGGGQTAVPAERSSNPGSVARGQTSERSSGTPAQPPREKEGGSLDDIKSKGLFFFLTTAAVFGFAALLTPCVFPMIPITVSFFQKQAEKEHHRPVVMALVYCLGIIGTFTILGMLMSIVFGAGALQKLGNNIALNLFIAGVLVFFAFNLLGMFEIRMPGWLLTYTAGKESRGGYLGVIFMALTFTLTSFTCTFAFAGLLLVQAMNGDRLWPIMGLVAFSTAFSLPFFFLALFPSYLKKLPKSGGWMNVVKVIMGLIELGAAFKYFGTADQSWNGQAAIFDFHLMVSAWAVISIAAALYLLGLFRLPHDVATDHIGVIRFVSAMSFLGLASYLGVGLFSAEKPQGAVWKYVAAFATPTFKGGTDPTGPYLKHGELKYALDFEQALKFAIAENKPLFLDFTGVNCANCRYMEDGPMSKPHIEKRLHEFVRVQLYTDAPVPTVSDPVYAERLRDFNAQLQESWFGDVSLPSYVVIPPDPSVLNDASRILSRLPGKRDEATFARFLDEGLNGWRELQAQNVGREFGKR
jgi:thiol:disulfide interchange protein DsbD